MKKIETIWHYILISALERAEFRFTQKELAQHFGYSLSTIHYAIDIPEQIGAVRKESKFFVLENFYKLLYFWASQRNLAREIIYSTACTGNIREIESLLTPESIFAGYSAASRILKEPASDYSKVYFYADANQLQAIQERFPSTKKNSPNLFVLKSHPTMRAYGLITTLPQTFVDIWNLKDWYAQDFLKGLEAKINAKISK